MNSITQNGYTTGQLSASQREHHRHRAGQLHQRPVGQTWVRWPWRTSRIPNGLAQFNNTAGRRPPLPAQAVYGQAGTARRRQIQSGSLEQSNVDVTAQLVNMITAQRAFQANAEMISTENQITQTVINIREQLTASE